MAFISPLLLRSTSPASLRPGLSMCTAQLQKPEKCGAGMARVVAASEASVAALGCRAWPTWTCEASEFPWKCMLPPPEFDRPFNVPEMGIHCNQWLTLLRSSSCVHVYVCLRVDFGVVHKMMMMRYVFFWRERLLWRIRRREPVWMLKQVILQCSRRIWNALGMFPRRLRNITTLGKSTNGHQRFSILVPSKLNGTSFFRVAYSRISIDLRLTFSFVKFSRSNLSALE